MDTNSIVAGIDEEILRLQQVKALLTGVSSSVKRKPGRPSGTTKTPKPAVVRTLSPEAREKIAAAQRARWAKTKKAAKKAARAAAPVTKKAAKAPTKAKKAVKVKKATPPKSEATSPAATAGS